MNGMNIKEFNKFCEIENFAKYCQAQKIAGTLQEQLDLYFKHKNMFLTFEEAKEIIDKKAHDFMSSEEQEIMKMKSDGMAFKYAISKIKKDIDKKLGGFKIIHIQEKQTYILYEIIFKDGTFYFKMKLLNYIKTPNGTTYYKHSPSQEIYCFFSHFFDRINQRVFDSELTRIEAIYKWFDEFDDEICNNSIAATNLKENKVDIENYFEKGLILGSIVMFDEKHNVHLFKQNLTNKLKTFYLFSTFVDNSLLKPDQLEAKKQHEILKKSLNNYNELGRKLSMSSKFCILIFNQILNAFKPCGLIKHQMLKEICLTKIGIKHIERLHQHILSAMKNLNVNKIQSDSTASKIYSEIVRIQIEEKEKSQ